MKLFIDTTQSMMMIAFFDQNWKVVKSFNLEVQQKVEQMLNFFNQLDQSFFKQLKTIYINLGPGSFTGSRIALLYVRTLAQMQKLPVFTCSTFELIQTQKAFWKRQNIRMEITACSSEPSGLGERVDHFRAFLGSWNQSISCLGWWLHDYKTYSTVQWKAWNLLCINYNSTHVS